MELGNGMSSDERRQLDDPLAADDLLTRAIAELPEMRPTRDLWPGVQARISPALSEIGVNRVRGDRVEGTTATVSRFERTERARPKGYVSISWAQLAIAASLLMAVTVSLTWLVARQPIDSIATPNGGVNLAQGRPGERVAVVRAESEPMGSTEGNIQKANFADAQYDAAIADLEKILDSERDRLDPRTVMVIERNLQTIDDAIREAREALDHDPANTYLNSHLADARRRKLELLRHATALASTGGD
jgi:hypothetical protein